MKNIYIGNIPIIEQTGSQTPGTINVNNYLRNPKKLSSVLSKVTSESDLSSYGNCLFCYGNLGDHLYIGYIDLHGYIDESDKAITSIYDDLLLTYYTTYPVAKIIRAKANSYSGAIIQNYFVYNYLVNKPGSRDVLDSDKWSVECGYKEGSRVGNNIYIGFLPTLTV